MTDIIPEAVDVARLTAQLPAVRPMGAPLVILDDQAMSRVAARIALSGIAPKSYRRGAEGPNGKRSPATENDPVDEDMVYVGIMHGQEVGLKPMQALQSIGVINGIPALFGDGALAVVLASGLVEVHQEWPMRGDIEGLDQNQRPTVAKDRVVAYTCRFKRKGQEARDFTFTVEDARRANLWGKAGPWQQYPDRMLQMRARAFLMRDVFADVLKGLAIYEEAIDFGNVEVVQKPDLTRSQAIRGRSRDALDAAFGAAPVAADQVEDAEFVDPASDAAEVEQHDAATGELFPSADKLPAAPAEAVKAVYSGKFSVFYKWAEGVFKDLPDAAVRAMVERDKDVWRTVAKGSPEHLKHVAKFLKTHNAALALDE